MNDQIEKMDRPPCLPGGCTKDVRHLGKGTSAGDWPCTHCGWSITEKFDLGRRRTGHAVVTRTRARNASHGTRSKYTTGCRCDECRAANTAYQADWERRNPAAKARHDAQRAAWKRSAKGRAASRAWKERNAEKVHASGRAYYAANREAVKATVAACRRREQADTIHTSGLHGTEWTATDEAELIRLYGTMPVRDLAARLHRTANGVRSRVQVLRRRGEL